MEKWYLGLLKKDTCFSEQFLAIRNNVAKGFPGSSKGKESACNAEGPGLIPG